MNRIFQSRSDERNAIIEAAISTVSASVHRSLAFSSTVPSVFFMHRFFLNKEKVKNMGMCKQIIMHDAESSGVLYCISCGSNKNLQTYNCQWFTSRKLEN